MREDPRCRLRRRLLNLAPCGGAWRRAFIAQDPGSISTRLDAAIGTHRWLESLTALRRAADEVGDILARLSLSGERTMPATTPTSPTLLMMGASFRRCAPETGVVYSSYESRPCRRRDHAPDMAVLQIPGPERLHLACHDVGQTLPGRACPAPERIVSRHIGHLSQSRGSRMPSAKIADGRERM